MIFEDLCDSDFSMLRDFMRYIVCVKLIYFMNDNDNMNMNMNMNMRALKCYHCHVLLPYYYQYLLFKQLHRCLEGPHKCLGKKPRCRLEINF
jgi:hypothetical protein